MKKLLVILWIAIFGQVASFAQIGSCWEIDYFKDEFGDPIQEPGSAYAKNTCVRNSYSYLIITFGINRHGVPVSTISFVYKGAGSFPAERREISAPATLSFKTKDGKVRRFSSNNDTNGNIWFVKDDAVQIAKLLESNDPYKLSLTVKSYIDGQKTYQYNVNGETKGIAQAIRKLAQIAKKMGGNEV